MSTRKHSPRLSVYTLGLVERLHANGHIRTAETYRLALSSFLRFRSGRDITISRLTPEIAEAYEAWMKIDGLSANTTSFYIRILRAIYRRAIEEHAIRDRQPFRRVYTGVARTVKRAVPLDIIRKIRRMKLIEGSSEDFARDLFLLSFMLRGISFIDLAYLRRSDLSHGRLNYRRRKTGQRLSIAWTPEMQEILSKWPSPEYSPYLLPILISPSTFYEDNRQPAGKSPGPARYRTRYRNASYRINRALKHIGDTLDLPAPLTLYVARHSWASGAYSQGVPVSVISEGMGHDSESTTRIYLASLDTSHLDKANALLLRKI